jgi:serine protease Do
VVLEVVSGSPADRAGIQPGDRVLSIGGKAMQRREQISRRIALLQPGTAVKIEVSRSGKNVELNATLEQRPSAEARYAMSSSGRIDALGLVLKPVPEAQSTEPGLKVSAIKPAGPAEHAGLALSDVVVEVNREPVGTLRDVEAALAEGAPDDEVLLKVRRGQSLRYFAVRPAP